ncbi:MAG: PAS domain S-box protein [Candidatus Aminicenantes bacterium]|nr:PAS domain S-box protein [Candidatus Aminicenantes bacterium]
MKVKDKTKEQLISELKKTHQRVIELEEAEARCSQTEQALRDSEQRLEILFEYAPEGIYMTDLEGNFMDGNKMAEQLVGYPRDELIGKNFLKINVLPKKQIPKAQALFIKNASGKSTGPDEFTLNRKDGSQITVEIRTYPIKSKDETLVLGIARDITERKHVEEIYRSVVDYSLQGLALIQDFRFFFVNTALAQLSGYTIEEFLDFTAEDMKDMIHPDDREYVFGIAQKRLKGEQVPPRYEFRFIRKDGTVGWTEQYARLIEYNGKPAAIVTYIDITDRKLAEEALLAEKNKAEQYLDIAGVMFVVLDRNHKVSLINKKGCQILGYRIDDIIGKKWFDNFLPERLREEVKVVLNKLMDGDVAPVEYSENSVLTSSGEERIIAWHNTLLKDDQGNIIGTLSSGEDITERKRAEEALRESEIKYRELADHLPQLVCETDSEGKIIYANDNAFEMLGYSPEDLGAGLTVWQMIEPQDLERVKKNIMKVLAGANIQGNEYSMRRRDGSSFPMLVYNSPIVREGETMGLRVIGVDVTAHKRAEEQLARSERRFRSVFENAVDGMALLYRDGTFIECNLKTEEIWGYSRKKVLKMKPWEFSPLKQPDGRDSKEKALELLDAAYQGESQLFEWVYIRPDGSLVDVEINLSCIELEGDVADVAIIRDITERKIAKAKIQESEDRFRSIVETTKEWIWMMDLDGRMTYNNPTIERILGYSPEELLGQNTLDYICEEDRHRIEKMLTELIAERQGWTNLIVRWQNKNGELRWLESNGAPVIDSKGQLVGYQGADRDITERKQAEEERIRNTQELLSAMEATIEAMALTVDMRDPFTAGHQRRVTELAVAIAKEMDLSEELIQGINMAGIVHDIGKMQVPAEILSKPGRLTDLEFSLIKNHPSAGYEIMKNIEFPWPVAKTILQHHERMDGSGYPNSISGVNILLEARILSVADVVEAMASHRPYRPALGIDKALEEISEKKGILYDSGAVDACLKIFRDKGFKFDLDEK